MCISDIRQGVKSLKSNILIYSVIICSCRWWYYRCFLGDYIQFLLSRQLPMMRYIWAAILLRSPLSIFLFRIRLLWDKNHLLTRGVSFSYPFICLAVEWKPYCFVIIRLHHASLKMASVLVRFIISDCHFSTCPCYCGSLSYNSSFCFAAPREHLTNWLYPQAYFLLFFDYLTDLFGFVRRPVVSLKSNKLIILIYWRVLKT